MGFQKNVPLTFEYEYDFAVDGGSTSAAIALRNVTGNAMAAGLVITNWDMSITTALDGTATPTVVMGNSVDPDGYAIDFFGDATPAGATLNRGDRAGALVWDDTNDHPIDYLIPSAAAAIPKITIATQALTAGKFKVVFTAYRP